MIKRHFELELTEANAHALSIIAKVLKKPASEIASSALEVQPTRKAGKAERR